MSPHPPADPPADPASSPAPRPTRRPRSGPGPKLGQILAVLGVLLVTALAISLILPGPRRALQGKLAPVAQRETITLRSVEFAQDHGEWRLTTVLHLENPGPEAVHPLGSPPQLRLVAADGSSATPATLPGRALPAELLELSPGAHWDGDLGWWLTPDQGTQPLTLHWLDQQIPLPVPATQASAPRPVPPPSL